jgi:hypothetical protein
MARTRTAAPEAPATPSSTKAATKTATKTAAKAAIKTASKTTSKTHRAPRRAAQSPAAAGGEFNPAEHHHEIAVAAYHCWLERGGAEGSPEEDWMRGEAEVRRRLA